MAASAPIVLNSGKATGKRRSPASDATEAPIGNGTHHAQGGHPISTAASAAKPTMARVQSEMARMVVTADPAGPLSSQESPLHWYGEVVVTGPRESPTPSAAAQRP